jgi:hypothetical protein
MKLNMYGFHKCRGDKSMLEFTHPLFLRNSPQNHHLIERRRSAEVTFEAVSQMQYISVPSIKEFDPMEEEPEVI